MGPCNALALALKEIEKEGAASGINSSTFMNASRRFQEVRDDLSTSLPLEPRSLAPLI